MNEKEIEVLLLDEEHKPILIEDECRDLQPILTEFVKCYAAYKDKPVEEWLSQKMQEQFPDRKSEEIAELTDEIITTLKVDEENQISLNKAISNGRSKESWFASTVQEAVSAMSVQEAASYLTNLDNALQRANELLYSTITTQAGTISQNPSLDGFIAEQYHAQTFNLKAEATGSSYRAVVKEPNGKGYAKNSVDIEIRDDYGKGKLIRRYQSKYCKDAKATARAFERGDYKGQQKLVPEGQESEIPKKCAIVIEAPDGTTSKPLTKSRAEQMRDEAQSGSWSELNWNEYATKDLALGIGKKAGYAALQGAVIGVGVDVAQKLWNGEEVETEEVIETALASGADFGVKAAAAGALKGGGEKEIITVIPKGTPAGTIANIAYVAIEDVKVAGKMITGELSLREGIDKIEQTTVATTAGLITMAEGTALGAEIGTVFGPAGTAIGGFLGGAVSYMAGTKVGETIVKGAQKLRDGAKKIAKEVFASVKNVGSKVVDGVKNFFSSIF